MRVKQTYQIREYESFITGKEIAGYKSLPEHTFRQLEDFILTNRGREADMLELMGLSAKKGVGKVITAKNYVGTITLNDGTTIEILPKIHSSIEDDASGRKTKRILVNMLKTLREAPYKSIQTSSVNIENMNISEIFVKMFLDEVFFIVKGGIKCNYEAVEENATFLKGKLLFSQQIKLNNFHKERCYVEHDEFTPNRPENKLLKSTLSYLYKNTTSSKNRTEIKILLDSFQSVDKSTNYKFDFDKCVSDRNVRDYDNALSWCRVFLMGKSFTPFAGTEVAKAFLFPMETLFERYIAALLRKKLGKGQFCVSAQDRTHYLFDASSKKFLIKPDIVVRNKSNGEIFVLDTKWKILDGNKPNFGISQADMYQMFAYQKKFGAKFIMLIYPKTEKLPEDECIEFKSKEGVIVYVKFVDLFSAEESISKLAQQFEGSK